MSLGLLDGFYELRWSEKDVAVNYHSLNHSDSMEVRALMCFSQSMNSKIWARQAVSSTFPVYHHPQHFFVAVDKTILTEEKLPEWRRRRRLRKMDGSVVGKRRWPTVFKMQTISRTVNTSIALKPVFQYQLVRWLTFF